MTFLSLLVGTTSVVSNKFQFSIFDSYILYIFLTFLNFPANTGNSQHYKLAKIIQHQYYNDRLTINDISILVTDRQIRYNQHVGPVCMPNKKVNPVGSHVKVMGKLYDLFLKQLNCCYYNYVFRLGFD